MHILVISSGTNNRDGWSTYTDSLAKALQLSGHTVTHHTESNPLRFLTNPLIAPIKAQTLRKAIRRTNPDIIHITVEPLAMMLAFLPKEIAAKAALTIHGSYGVRMFQDRNAKRATKVLRRIGTCITVSEYTKKRLEEVAGRQSNIHVVHNAIELPKLPAAPANDIKHIISIGGIKPRKGTVEALEALAEYRKTKANNVHFTIVGAYKNDTYYEQVQNVIYANNLSDCVTITGSVSDSELESILQTADVLLMPAKTTPDTFEGFGLVYIEANAYGVPCIGPNDSGATEAIKQGVSGFSCDPNNAEEIANAMYAILEEQAISRDDCRRWAEQFSLQNLGAAMNTVYKTIS